MTEVAVLGCGPAGMLAAHAAAMVFDRVDIYSNPVPSRIGGAQYLHCAIPMLTSQYPDARCTLVKHGTADGYGRKVYGEPREDVSWYRYPDGEYQIWNLRDAYDRAWRLYKDWIKPGKLVPHDVRRLQYEYQYVISTIPLFDLVPEEIRDRYGFHWQTVWITQRPHVSPNNVIEYNGNPATPYYRRSLLFDVEGLEYSARHHAPNDAVTVRKPLGCERAHQIMPGVHKVGRYGTFQKKELAHDAFIRTLKICTQFSRPDWAAKYLDKMEGATSEV